MEEVGADGLVMYIDEAVVDWIWCETWVFNRRSMMMKDYVVTLSASVLADTTVAVRADSAEEAARLALESAEYDMEKWHHEYERDPLVDATACNVSLATGADTESADQRHLLNA